MALLGYVNEAEIVAFMKMINKDFVKEDINELVYNSMYHYLNERADIVYNKTADDARVQRLYVDGNSTLEIYCPQIPIISISKIATILQDETQCPFIINGAQKNIWWDNETGRIWIKVDYEVTNIERNAFPWMWFPDRPKSVVIEGKFGGIVTELVKLIQLLLALKQYQLLNPKKYATDIAEETIGKYSYKLERPGNVTAENQRKGIDGWIDFLFKQLPKTNSMGLEAI